ncbi:MAG: efflux transporter outer membrane subunit [Parachlamydiaceae bacterium]|nr:efflux transporter outer membrane subunit [Parachlamydiaceae bacterium]
MKILISSIKFELNKILFLLAQITLSYFHYLILIFLFVGCQVGPKYHCPLPEIPDDWKAETATIVPTPYYACWWEVFNEEQLNTLEQLAVANNPTVYIALERVLEARAVAGVKKADLYPQLDLNGKYSDTGQLFQFFLPPGVLIPNANKISPFFRIHQFLYFLTASLNYEVDLWGRLRGEYASALYSAEAQQQDYYASLLSLTAELANHYFQLRTFDAQMDYLQATVDSYQKNFQLVKARFDKGIINYGDVANASLQVTNAQSNYEDTARQRRIEENAIAVLIGTLPSEFSLESNPLAYPPPVIPAGVPATIIAQRPDIAEAERNMAAQHKLINVAYASFLPSLSLTGALGYSSPDFGQFLKGISRYWTFGANAREPLFDGGRNCANLREAWARYRVASGEYQQTVFKAFQEVENALSNLERQDKQSKLLSSSVKSSEDVYRLSSNRYKKGLTSYLEVIDSERAKLNVQLNDIGLLGARYLSTVQLIKALGGSWEMSCSD